MHNTYLTVFKPNPQFPSVRWHYIFRKSGGVNIIKGEFIGTDLETAKQTLKARGLEFNYGNTDAS